MRARAAVVVTLACAMLTANTLAGSAASALSPPPGVRTLSSVPTGIWPRLVFRTGERLLLFGDNSVPQSEQQSTRNIGVVYDVKTGGWKRMAAPPFHPPILWPIAVWSGRELVVVGIACDNRATPEDDEPRCYPGSLVAASYNPRRDRWRRVHVPDSLAAGFNPGNGGSSGVAIGALDGNALFAIAGQTWSVDPRTERWEQRDIGSGYGACVAGHELVAQSNSALAVVDADPRAPAAPVPVPAVDAPGGFVFVCAEDAVYAYTMVLTSAWRFDVAARTRHDLPAPPQPTAFVGNAAWTGRGLLISVGIRSRDPVTTTRDGFLFDPTSNTWRTTPNAIVEDARGGQIWSDGYAFQLGYERSGKIALQTYRPK